MLGQSKKTETAELKENLRRESQRNSLIFSSADVNPKQMLRLSLYLLLTSRCKIGTGSAVKYCTFGTALG